MTFKMRPLCNMTRRTALWKKDMPIKIRHYNCFEASNIDGLTVCFTSSSYQIAYLQIKRKLLNLCLIVYFKTRLGSD